MTHDLLAEAFRLSREGMPFAMATVVRCEPPTSAKPGAKALIRADGSMQGWIGGSCAEPVVVKEALGALRDGRPRLVALVGEGSTTPGRPRAAGGAVFLVAGPVRPGRARCSRSLMRWPTRS